MAKLTKRQEAQNLALGGETEAAVAAFSDLKKQGNAISCASLAELSAFRGEWRDVLANVEIILATPKCVEALNVFTDMVGLAARAITLAGKWKDGARFATVALEKVSSIPNFEIQVIVVQRLIEFIESKGQGDRFKDGAYFAIGEPQEPLAERKKEFDDAILEWTSNRKKGAKLTSDDLEELYGLAATFRYDDGAVQVYDRVKGALPTIFDNVSFAAAALVRAGRRAEAWDAVRTSLPSWCPVVVSQIAPVELLVDDALRSLMTPERCEEVLRCPRGPAARRKKGKS